MNSRELFTNLQPSVVVDSPAGSYPIVIRPGCLSELAKSIVENKSCDPSQPYSSIVIASDENVFPLYGESLADQFRSSGLDVCTLVAKAGENSKSVEMASDWWSRLAKRRVDRNTLMVAIGGGVVGDLAGFVGSTILRGIDVLQVPTSLLSQVDSSVGGKVGINLPEGKNLVGQFCHPKQVWIDSDVLGTLDDENYRAGLGEVVKYAVISDQPFFDWLRQNVDPILKRDPDAISYIIKVCLQRKAEIVAKDPTEKTGLRAILNFGHTIGHAVEKLAGYGRILHGNAVAIGMVAETKLAVELGICSAEVLEQLFQLLVQLKLPTELPELDFDAVVATMGQDKKIEGKKLTFVLPERLGKVIKVVDPEINFIKKVILQ